MKLEKMNYGKEKVHKIFLYGLISVVVLLLAVTFISSRANYKISSSVQLAKGKINYKAPDLNVIAMYQEDTNGSIIGTDGKKYKELDKNILIPSANEYEINEENSYCYKETSTIHDESAKLYTKYGEHIISGISKNDKCYLYFDKIVSRTMSELLKNYYINKKVRTSTNKDFNIPFGEPTEKTVYMAEDDYGLSYYFAGGTADNWIKFGKENGTGADMWWRIIRINGNGSIRMIYTGTTAPTSTQKAVMTGTQTQLGTMAYNIERNDNMYVGFYYTSNQVHGYGTSSNIYSNPTGDTAGTTLKGFYSKSISGKDYETWVDKNVGFCNDRVPYTNNNLDTPDIGGGTGKTVTYFGAFLRLRPNDSDPTSSSRSVEPSLKCSFQGTSGVSYKDSDLFTAKGTTDIGSTHGNKLLDYPVGLITADEVSFAGIVFDWTNESARTTTNYLYTGRLYNTLTPSMFFGETSRADTLAVHDYGYIVTSSVNHPSGIRPVINLKSDTPLIGNGTYNNPYEVVT